MLLHGVILLGELEKLARMEQARAIENFLEAWRALRTAKRSKKTALAVAARKVAGRIRDT